ncbi:hypothetical protein OIU77_015849 [Salix suchowensis]|uniref:PARP-type domain-containing protein n=1 Tax=Salix suchowensis TaxID=1278906 RepID=A0ABQ8ZIB2_9ROSI|nr:hypothetical protein OIU77_015849 [Salix suchowensis]
MFACFRTTPTSISKNSLFYFRFTKHTSLCSSLQNSKSAMPPSKAHIIAEYAKSNRSSCKTCSKAISAKALRLGLVSRDSRGFDMTKWHHLGCFSDKIGSTELIGGFDSLLSCDQEALKKLMEQVSNEDQDVEISRKSSKRTDEDANESELEKNNTKKAKLPIDNEDANLDIAFSLSDVRDNYKDATLLPKWKAFQTIIFLERDDGLRDSNKIAAFDFDGCLAKTSVKRVGADAWSIMFPSIPDKLLSLYNDGFKLVIFTNESNIDRWKNKRQVAVDSKIGRLNNFIKHVKVPIQVFIACGYDGKVEDPFRKPKPGMWQIMEKHFNSGISIDMDQLFSFSHNFFTSLFKACWLYKISLSTFEGHFKAVLSLLINNPM